MATSKNDKLILQLKKEIEDKKALLAKSEKFIPETNCSLTLFGIKYNLHVQTSNQLAFLKAFLKSLDSPNLILEGYKIEDWIKDIDVKYSMLNIQLEKDRLKTLENKLYSLLSNETKVSLEIEDIMKSI
jgi:hypothetical protein